MDEVPRVKEPDELGFGEACRLDKALAPPVNDVVSDIEEAGGNETGDNPSVLDVSSTILGVNPS